MRLQVIVEEEPITAFFSGDTIVASTVVPRRSCRGSGAGTSFPAGANARTAVFWFLIAAGYKTYRFLPVFFREFYPTWRAPTPAFHAHAFRVLGRAKFGDDYDAADGVVRFREPMPLRSGVADVSFPRLRDPHVAFFVRANPGHSRGDELACLCEISAANLTPAGQRMLRA
jgi:hypothetical protein